MQLNEFWSISDEESKSPQERLNRFIFSVNWSDTNIDWFIKRPLEMNNMPLSEQELKLWAQYQNEVAKPVAEMNDEQLEAFINDCESTLFETKAKQAKAQAERVSRAQKNGKQIFNHIDPSNKTLKTQKVKTEHKPKVNLFGNADFNELINQLRDGKAQK